MMDILLSLPMLGYFFVPSAGTFGTFGTSVNLLFFYLTWSTLVLSQPPLKVEMVGTLAARSVFFVVPAMLFLLLDTLVPSLVVGFKRQGAAALPTRTGGAARVTRSPSRTVWYRVVALGLFNLALGLGMQAAVEALLTLVLHLPSALKVTTALPLPWSIAKEIARALLLREVLQYYAHRYLHSPSAPSYLSNLHASYFHAIRSPYSFVAHYDHPLPYLLWRFLPLYLPAIAFRTHLITYLLLLSLVSLEEALTFSGYAVVPGILLGGFARRQDLHCQSRGRGNFAPWGLMDWIHGTSIGADVMDDVKDEVEKHQVAERTGSAWRGAKKSGKAGVRAWSSKGKASKKA